MPNYDSHLRNHLREAAFDAVEPLLSAKDPKLTKEIEADFKKVYAALDPYRDGAGFVSYTELTAADTRKLATSIDTLAEKPVAGPRPDRQRVGRGVLRRVLSPAGQTPSLDG